PMVGQVSDFAALRTAGRRLLVDGKAGTVTVDPRATDAEGWSVTRPGAESPSDEGPGAGRPRLEVNVNPLGEGRPAGRQGEGGVGLLRRGFFVLAPPHPADGGGAGRHLPQAADAARRPARQHPDVRPAARQAGVVLAPGGCGVAPVRLAAGAGVAAVAAV